MNKEKENLLCVAIVSDAYHMQGLVKMKTFTEKPENICHLKCIDEHGKSIVVEKTSKANIYRIKDITNRTDAEKIIGTKIYVTRQDLPKIDSDEEFYMDELVGVKVRNTSDIEIGVVTGCFNFGAGDILEIRFNNDKSEMYLFTRENFPEANREFVKLSVEIEE